MEAFYMALAIILVGFIFVGIFVIGALFMRMQYRDAMAEARYEAMHNEFYRLAGVRSATDPRPYVPPRCMPRAQWVLPGMGKLDRMLKEGKRGTIMWRAGDRNK